AAGPVALAVGLGALAVARGPGRFTTYAGGSGLAATLTVVAGLALIGAGLVTALGRRAWRIGDLALLAGLVWFAPVWVGWDRGPPLVRSLGMVAAGFIFPLLLHLVLAYPSGRLRGAVARALVAAVYLETALVALAQAFFRDPFYDPNCWANCTDNDFLVWSLPRLTRAIEAADRWLTAAAAAALVAVCVRRLLRDSGPARRALLPVALPAILLASVIMAHTIVLQGKPLEDPSDQAFRAIFVTGCVAVLLLAAGLVWAAVRIRVQRRAVARIATSLGQAPAPGSLQAALAQAVGDPDLEIAYWLPAAQHYVDANGQPIAQPIAGPGRAATALVRDGRQIAVISHTAALPDLERELGAAVRLALENERLQAEVLAQLEDLRASRVRIVETGDAERRRLERDLHDGAQQRLLALSYDLRLARAQAAADGDSQIGSLLTQATGQAQAALDELRELAHGIYPAILTEAGLGPALATLADAAPLPVEVRDAAQGRYPAAVETAAYLLVTEALDDAAGRDASHATVSVARDGGRLVVTVEDDGTDRTAEMVQLADRVG
ncbi:MAG TPA: histidine kinase, partial [Actinomycetota bacterium]|nr:histidine kinase [Actinomycetota bacterium]